MLAPARSDPGGGGGVNDRRKVEFEKWRSAVYWFSIIFLATGIMLIGFSIWAAYVNPLTALISILPVSFIVMGVFIFLVSFLGWYSSTRENRTLLLVYIMLIVTSIIVTVALTILTYRNDKLNITNNLYDAWAVEYARDNSSSVLYDLEQENLCCGFYNSSNLQVPDDCVDLIPVQSDGCVDALVQSSEDVLAVVKITGLVSAFVQAVGVIFAGLAFHYAPTRSDQDRLLEEEAERLNKSWMAQPGGPPVTSYDRGRG